MRIGDPAVIRLIHAKHDAEQDLFLLPDVPFSPADAAALSAALRENLLVFLPGDFHPAGVPDGVCFPYGKERENGGFHFPPAPFVCYADIRLAGNEAFGEAMRAAGIYEWILPFADCADPAEHGYRRSYAFLAENRASDRHFTGITAIFDDVPADTRYQKLFDSSAFLTVGLPDERKIPAVHAENEAERMWLLHRACALRPSLPTAVLFPTRRHAEDFRRSLSCLCPCGVVHGGLSREQNAETLRRFRVGEFSVLAATKHLLPSAPFLNVQRVYYAGLPFSAAHFGRCAALLPPGKLPVAITVGADFSLNTRLSASCADALELPRKAFCASRKEKQDRVLALLDGTDAGAVSRSG